MRIDTGNQEMVLIQPVNPWTETGENDIEYSPPVLVLGPQWREIDQHQHGLVRINAQEKLFFTGIVPSADHDRMKHVQEGWVNFGQVKWRSLEPDLTRWCVAYTERENAAYEKLAAKHGREGRIIVRDPEAAKRSLQPS